MHTSTDKTLYRGRFAPSPTGPLHFGSLVAALGSYLDARHNRGEWLVRVEDLDPPREVAGAAYSILHTLEAFGLEWDGPVVYQSMRNELYDTALEQLARNGKLYGCACTRKEIADSSIKGQGTIYPGTCRNGLPAGRTARSVRVRVDDACIRITDRLQGIVEQSLADEVGDFVLRRADQLVAYQLAVVIDDAEQGITDVVRGADLLDSTPRQYYLQQQLGLPAPRYLHLPVAVNASREKLGKQTHARAVQPDAGNRILIAALTFLQQALPDDAAMAGQAELLQWATVHWNVDALPRKRLQPAPEIPSA
ncbi:MAG: tRNA glutamyl-Q(34) synthetase GluQRS [Gammaproteobacteria bacterium]|nr:tRNA glutamyl-Q(34) synthetase GluQRS [Gammaproteobacteria bacterium]